MLTLYAVGCGRAAEEQFSGRTFIRPTDGMEMVYVPAGEFRMGSSEEDINAAYQVCQQYWDNCDRERFLDETPRHKVELTAYWIDRTEVSNAQYRKCAEAGVCDQPECWIGLQFTDPDQPVVCVTWDQAGVYCTWVGGRLPSEAEWEYAARGSASLMYPWGNTFVGDRLNYCDQTCGRPRSDPEWDDGQLYTAPVGQYPDGSSWCGALDMAGNVSEWVRDWYTSYDPDQRMGSTGSDGGYLRSIRGGSWFLTRVEARPSWREGILPGNWFDDLGFRCVIQSLVEGQ